MIARREGKKEEKAYIFHTKKRGVVKGQKGKKQASRGRGGHDQAQRREGKKNVSLGVIWERGGKNRKSQSRRKKKKKLPKGGNLRGDKEKVSKGSLSLCLERVWRWKRQRGKTREGGSSFSWGRKKKKVGAKGVLLLER